MTATYQQLSTLTELITEHLGDFAENSSNWHLCDSTISGRGLKATRDISVGEIIFRERALLSGPISLKNVTEKGMCCVCYHQFDENLQPPLKVCKNGCSLPVCESCTLTSQHIKECELFRSWQPKDPECVQNHTLRVLSAVRAFFLDDRQKELLQLMQANPDRFFQKDLERVSNYFVKPFFSAQSVEEDVNPNQQLKKALSFLGRTICVFNTNAFESRSKLKGQDNEVTIKALFPLAALMNHCCVSNTSHYFENGIDIIVCAARSIAAGEEIFTSYTQTLWSNLARKGFLLLTKQFQCECNRCSDSTVRIIYCLKIMIISIILIICSNSFAIMHFHNHFEISLSTAKEIDKLHNILYYIFEYETEFLLSANPFYKTTSTYYIPMFLHNFIAIFYFNGKECYGKCVDSVEWVYLSFRSL